LIELGVCEVNMKKGEEGCRREDEEERLRLASSSTASDNAAHNDDADDDDDDDDDSSSSDHWFLYLERAAHATLHLAFEIKRISTQSTAALDSGASTFMLKLAPRIRALEAAVISRSSETLERLLRHGGKNGNAAAASINSAGAGAGSGISSSSSSASLKLVTRKDRSRQIMHCFRSFVILSRSSEAEAIFARVAIFPIIKEHGLSSAGNLDSGGSRGHCANLSPLLNGIA
jgi:hypothetical protein